MWLVCGELVDSAEYYLMLTLAVGKGMRDGDYTFRRICAVRIDLQGLCDIGSDGSH